MNSSNMTDFMVHGSEDLARLRNVTGYNECDGNFATCKAQKILYYVFGPMLLLLSVIGTILSITVMRSKSLRHSSTSVLIICLALSDCGAVLTGLTRHIILKSTGVDVRKLSAASCVAHRFILYLTLDTSAWILVAISVERFFAVCKPHLHSRYKKPRVAIITVLVIVILQALLNLQVGFLRGKETTIKNNQTIIKTCGYLSPDAKLYWINVYGYFSMTNYCIFPFFAMLVFNCLIIRKLYRLNKKLVSKMSVNSRKKVRQSKTQSMTKMLLCVTLYFLIFTAPTFIFTMIQDRKLFYTSVTAYDYATSELVDAILTLMLYLNHSISFLLYTMSGNRFRKELKKLLKICTGNMDRTGESSFSSTTGSTKKMRLEDPTEL